MALWNDGAPAITSMSLVLLTTAAAPAAASATVGTELFSAAKTTRSKADLLAVRQVKLAAMVTVLGSAATAAIKLQYVTAASEAATWAGTDTGASVVLGNGTAGLMHDSGWVSLASGAWADNLVIAAVVGVAFGTTAPSISSLTAYFR